MSAVSESSATISYNNFAFNKTAKCKVRTEYIQDDAQRTVVYEKVTLTVQAIIADDDGTGPTLAQIRSKLSAQGKGLIFTGQGYDNLLVNVSAGSGTRDVKWGPMPKILAWSPVGSAQACEVTWEVVVHLTPCRKYRGLMSLNYDIRFSMNNTGLSTRTITGHLVIAQTRNGHSIPDSADRYRELVRPKMLPGYKRESEYGVSTDKSRLDFTIVDTQINSPNPYPPFVTNIRASHRANYSRLKPMRQNRIVVTVDTAFDAPQSAAIEPFYLIAVARLERARRENSGAIIIDDIDVSEDMFDHVGRTTFTISYRVTAPYIEFEPTKLGLFSDVGTDWSTWHTSMGATHSPRGHSGLNHQPKEDSIVDLCEAGAVDTTTTSLVPRVVPSLLSPALRNSQPPAKRSWLMYESVIRIRESRKVIVQDVLQQPDSPGEDWDLQAIRTPLFKSARTYPNIVQEEGATTYFADLIGYAERAGHKIPRPSLKKVGDQDAVYMDGVFDQRVKGQELGIPIYQARWFQTFALAGPPGEVGALENPMLGVDANGRVKK